MFANVSISSITAIVHLCSSLWAAGGSAATTMVAGETYHMTKEWEMWAWLEMRPKYT